jgi:hypothetical protein
MQVKNADEEDDQHTQLLGGGKKLQGKEQASALDAIGRFVDDFGPQQGWARSDVTADKILKYTYASRNNEDILQSREYFRARSRESFYAPVSLIEADSDRPKTYIADIKYFVRVQHATDDKVMRLAVASLHQAKMEQNTFGQLMVAVMNTASTANYAVEVNMLEGKVARCSAPGKRCAFVTYNITSKVEDLPEI